MNRRTEAVLIIAGYAPSLTNFRGPLLKAMRRSGRRVIAAAPGLGDDKNAVAALGRLGVECRDVPLRRTGISPVADLKLVLSMVKLMRSERPAAVLGYTVKAVIYGLIAAAIAGVPRRYALITGLGYGFAEGGGRKASLVRSAQEMLYKIALRRATKVFFQNHDDPELFRELRLLPPKLPVVVVNGSGIDLDAFPQQPLRKGPIRFLLVARLIAPKGIREYAEAAGIVRERNRQAEFHLVGGFDSNPDAITRDELRRWQGKGLLVWHGEVGDVRPHFAAAHVYVLPSYYREGTPRSILEALATGRAVITTDAPGCRETVVEGENGFLVPPRDPQALADAMTKFENHPELISSMGRRSRELAVSKYDVVKVNAQMLRGMELA